MCGSWCILIQYCRVLQNYPVKKDRETLALDECHLRFWAGTTGSMGWGGGEMGREFIDLWVNVPWLQDVVNIFRDITF